MSKREELNENLIEEVVGGKITFDWDGAVGHCGLNGDKSYTFTNKGVFVGHVTSCFQQGLSDAECISSLLASGIIY